MNLTYFRLICTYPAIKRVKYKSSFFRVFLMSEHHALNHRHLVRPNIMLRTQYVHVTDALKTPAQAFQLRTPYFFNKYKRAQCPER
jgi:hypothetical protein